VYKVNPELVEQITKLVYEKLQSQTAIIEESQHAGGVKFWNHTAKREPQLLASPGGEASKQAVETSQIPIVESDEMIDRMSDAVGIEDPFDKEELEELISQTPARIGVGRAGLRPKTHTWLKFRYDHAAAVDAVYGDVNPELLDRLSLFKVNTKVADKEVYVRRPDFGRKLSDEAKQLITLKCKKAPTVQIIVSDGLSSKAVEENLEDVYLSLNQSLQSLGLDTGTPFFIEKGRVAAMDDVGELLKPKVIVYLIGERPGLVSAESLSAYLCFEPKLGTIEADRMVISNIHRGGIPPVEAGAYIGTVVQKILTYQASGVSLVQKEQ
jgi:ethanolamine ammonia-lyase small subunit